MQCKVAVVGLLALALAAVGEADPAPALPQSAVAALDQAQGRALEQAQLDALNSDLYEDKRAWQNLHGGWGKRGWQDMNSAWGKRAWQDMNSAWGKRGWQDMNSAWGKRAWQNLHGGWGKRGWQDMNSAWGKRAWNNLHGGWGKRAWNNLNGGWGKRDAADILELMDASNNGQDGSYDTNTIDQYAPLRQILSNNAERIMNEYGDDQDYAKRQWSSTEDSKINDIKPPVGKREPGWNNLKGLWGKRSVMENMEESQSGFPDRRDE